MLEESTTWGENNISGNPLFMSITSENFHLLPESLALTLGTQIKNILIKMEVETQWALMEVLIL